MQGLCPIFSISSRAMAVTNPPGMQSEGCFFFLFLKGKKGKLNILSLEANLQEFKKIYIVKTMDIKIVDIKIAVLFPVDQVFALAKRGTWPNGR